MDLEAMPAAEADTTNAQHAVSQPTMEQVCESIWRQTEVVLELLRERATNQVRMQKKPDVLWIDDVTRTQANTVIAVRQLSEVHPEGITLGKLAASIGVTPAAASVMVDLLVKKKMLKRTRSKDDRRSVLIRLTPETTRLFEITEQSLRESVMRLTESLGSDVIRDWHRILSVASTELADMTAPTAPAAPGFADPETEDPAWDASQQPEESRV